MSLARYFLSEYQYQNPEGMKMFNNDLIYARKNDDTASFVFDIFKSLEVIEGIQILNVREVENEAEFPISAGFKRIDYSRLKMIEVTIKVAYDGEEETFTRVLYAPRLVDDFFYFLNGSTYFPVFQFIDRGTYRTRDRLTLKTMLLPLPFIKIEDTVEISSLHKDGYIYNGSVYKVDLFSSPINPINYFFAHRGVAETIKYLGYEDYIFLDEAENFKAHPVDPAEFAVFEVSKRVNMIVNRALLDSEPDEARTIMTILLALRDARFSLDDLTITEENPFPDQLIWLRRLGKNFTKSNTKTDEKGAKILNSFVNIVETRTRENLSFLAESDREDTFAIVRWIMKTFGELSKVDNMDLTTKRIRISEYIVHNLLLKMSNNRYRLINTKRKTFKTLKNIFMYISPMFLINQLVKNELLYYSNHCNQHDLFTVALKFTLCGRQAAGNKTDIGIQHRGLHESYIGRLSLTNASASSPGVTGTISPFACTDGQFFEPNDIEQLLEKYSENLKELGLSQ